MMRFSAVHHLPRLLVLSVLLLLPAALFLLWRGAREQELVGQLDSSFGSNGRVFIDLGTEGARITSLAIQSGNALVAAGTIAGSEIGLARLREDGSLDPSFGSGGTITTRLQRPVQVADMVILDDGKILVLGTISSAGFESGAAAEPSRDSLPSFEGSGSPPRRGSAFVLVRFDRDGSVDPSFGSGGVVEFRARSDDDTASLPTAESSQWAQRVPLFRAVVRILRSCDLMRTDHQIAHLERAARHS
jgi:uncharacterized delta-60 repeat protein